MYQRLNTLFLVLLVSAITPNDVDARAFCALRDPVNSIRTLFPESDKYRSVVRAIDSEARDKISDSLPFTLHFNELGKHTLYIAENQTQPIGFVHVRSELTKWGLVEMAWALTPNLSIRNVDFQRCRIPGCSDKYLTNVLDMTVGKSFSQLKRMISEDGKTLKEKPNSVSDDEAKFILAAIKSALKTIIVTSFAWQKEVTEVNRQLLLESVYGSGMKLRQSFDAVNEETIKQLDKEMGGGGSLIDRNSVQAFQIYDANKHMGTIVSATWRDGKYQGMFSWLFNVEGTIKAIQAVPAWPNAEIEESFTSLYGQAFIDIEQCNSTAQLIGYELYFLSKQQTQ